VCTLLPASSQPCFITRHTISIHSKGPSFGNGAFWDGVVEGHVLTSISDYIDDAITSNLTTGRVVWSLNEPPSLERDKILAAVKRPRYCGWSTTYTDLGDPSKAEMCGARFRQKFTLEDAIGSHACSLQASKRAHNGFPLGCSLLLPVHTVNCVQTRKVRIA
jgi:hypothetical protein